MKVTFIIELLLICVLIAFVAGGAVERKASVQKAKQQVDVVPATDNIDEVDDDDDVEESEPVQEDVEEAVEEVANNDIEVLTVAPLAPSAPTTNASLVNESDPDPINKYCTCTKSTCKCCRDVGLPVLPVRGTGCATIQFLEDEKMLVTLQYGDLVLVQRQISGKRSTPVCIPMPGGYSRFCGRVYGISRKSENFKACLALEIRAEEQVEAALRVSCFQFGPKGLSVSEAEPLPPVKVDVAEEEEDDLFGLDGGSEDDEYAEADDDDDDDDDAPAGGGGLSGFLGGLGGGGGGFGSGLVSSFTGLFGL